LGSITDLAYPGGGFIEIGPGKYSRKHWQHGFIFIHDLAFTLAEGIIMKHYSDYDHYGTNDIPKEVGMIITGEWREVSNQLNKMSNEQVRTVLNLGSYGRLIDDEIALHKTEIIRMLSELADKIDEFYDKNNWVCILGI